MAYGLDLYAQYQHTCDMIGIAVWMERDFGLGRKWRNSCNFIFAKQNTLANVRLPIPDEDASEAHGPNKHHFGHNLIGRQVSPIALIAKESFIHQEKLATHS